jgi:hypothetical protein
MNLGFGRHHDMKKGLKWQQNQHHVMMGTWCRHDGIMSPSWCDDGVVLTGSKISPINTFVTPQVFQFIGPSNDGRRQGRGTYLFFDHDTFNKAEIDSYDLWPCIAYLKHAVTDDLITTYSSHAESGANFDNATFQLCWNCQFWPWHIPAMLKEQFWIYNILDMLKRRILTMTHYMT